MDLAAYRTRVRKLTGINMTALVSDAYIDELVNEAHREVCRLPAGWPFMYTETPTATVAGTATLSLPTGMRSISAVTLPAEGDRARLRQVTVAELDALDVAAADAPEVYAPKSDDELILWPTPDAAYSVLVRGYRTIPKLVTTVVDPAVESLEPLFESEFHPILAYMVASKLLIEDGDDSGRVPAYSEEAGSILRDMHTRYFQTHDTGLFQMGGRAVADRRRWSL